MILKIETVTNSWRFIDSIAIVHTDIITPEKYKKQYDGNGRAYNSVLLSYYEQKDGELIRTTENCSFSIKEITAYFKDNRSENYLTDRTVYLMSDEGKTIERIN